MCRCPSGFAQVLGMLSGGTIVTWQLFLVFAISTVILVYAIWAHVRRRWRLTRREPFARHPLRGPVWSQDRNPSWAEWEWERERRRALGVDPDADDV